MDNFYTYVYYDKSRNNEPFYVGKGCGNRAYSHLKRTDKHPFTQRLQYMKKNGVEPVIGIYGGLDEEFALFLEQEIISHLGRKDLGTGPLLNLTDGGDGMNVPSADVREKMSTAKKGKSLSAEHRAKIAAALKGKTYASMSDEGRANLSAAKKGKPLSAEHIAKVAAANKGKTRAPFSDEHKAKIGAALKGKPLSAETRAKMQAAQQKRRAHNKTEINEGAI